MIFTGSPRCPFCVPICICPHTTVAVTRGTNPCLAASRRAGAVRYRQRRRPLVYPPLSVIRPSTLLVLFLSTRLLLGLARVRMLWLIPTATNAATLFTMGFVFTLLSIVIESTGKESSLAAATAKLATPEPFSGFWKRASFAWLAKTFR